MKANYQKPVVLFESFALNQTIAENCGVTGGGNSLGTPHWGDGNSCTWTIGNYIVLFMSTNSACVDPVVGEDDMPEGLCYNTPAPGQTIFSS